MHLLKTVFPTLAIFKKPNQKLAKLIHFGTKNLHFNKKKLILKIGRELVTLGRNIKVSEKSQNVDCNCNNANYFNDFTKRIVFFIQIRIFNELNDLDLQTLTVTYFHVQYLLWGTFVNIICTLISLIDYSNR